MMYQFVPTTKDKFGKDLSHDQIKDQFPTRVSVKGGMVFDVVDGCLEASSKLAVELATLGFEMRSRPSVKVKRSEPEVPQTEPQAVEVVSIAEEEQEQKQDEEEQQEESDLSEDPAPRKPLGRVQRKS